ncbi:hypothetical protein COBT_001090 [Conglomerata obtusa]
MRNKNKKENENNLNKPLIQDIRGRIPRIDPKMAEYMGRIYIDKDKYNSGCNEDVGQHLSPTGKYKFKEFVYQQSKKDEIEEIEMKLAASGLVKLMEDVNDNSDSN